MHHLFAECHSINEHKRLFSTLTNIAGPHPATTIAIGRNNALESYPLRVALLAS
jgi:hypothetical protein